MTEPPRVMSTQHPDNATVPFFAEGEVIEGEDEIQEAYYVYSHLGADEQMWDFEGKEGDEYAVKKLLSRFDRFFLDETLGEDVRLTIRGPNPDVESSDAKVLLEILESIPRSFDAAKLFYESYDREIVAPIHEVIVPMVTDAEQIDLVHDWYTDSVAAKDNFVVSGKRTVAEWVGEFHPKKIGVIPLIEDRESLLGADEILRGYAEGRDLESQRVFLARSDPALNYGALSADLINKVALKRLYEAADDLDIELYPIFGAGSVPFRGNLSPHTVDATLEAYPEIQTFTAQSAFKYDYPTEDTTDGIETLRTATRDRSAPQIDEERALEVIDRMSEAYSRQVKEVAPLVNHVSNYVPARRARKLHIGLFGYAREVGEVSLPRAITYTASLYSIGFPPSFMGVNGLEDRDIDFVADTFPAFFDHLEKAAKYYNPASSKILPIDEEEATAALELVDADPDPEHRGATDAVIESLENESGANGIRASVVRAAQARQFLG